MPDECRVCASSERAKIEIFLANAGMPMVGATIWDFDAWELSMHRDEHMHGIALKVNTDPVRVIQRLQDLMDIAWQNVHDAQGGKGDRDVTNAIKTAILAAKTQADVTGASKQLDLSMILPMWKKMQSAILTALEDFPDARKRVLEKLEAVQLEQQGLH